MAKHLSDEKLMDLVEGAGEGEAREHLAACPACRARVEEAGHGLALARSADVPEPSALYWEAFRRQVGRRLVLEHRTSWRWRLIPLLAAAAAMIVVVPSIRGPRLNPTSRAAVVPAWSALPPADDDPGLSVLAGFAASEGELLPPREGREVTELLGDLTEEESLALADALRAQLKDGQL